MKIPPLLTGTIVVLLAISSLFTGCQNAGQPGTGSSGGGSTHGPRVPAGAATRHAAAVKFFAAYKAGDRQAAREVAADAAINKLNWNSSTGTNPTLKLLDDTHIYYEGGSIELHLAKNAAGRWYVSSVMPRAD